MWASIGSVWASDSIRALIEQIDHYANLRQETGNSSAEFEKLIKNSSIELLFGQEDAAILLVDLKELAGNKWQLEEVEQPIESSMVESIDLLQRLIKTNLISHSELLKLIDDTENVADLYLIVGSIANSPAPIEGANILLQAALASPKAGSSLINGIFNAIIVSKHPIAGVDIISFYNTAVVNQNSGINVWEKLLDTIANSEYLLEGASVVINFSLPTITEDFITIITSA